jgi:hypothetical protein
LEAGVSLTAAAAFWATGGGFAACLAESDLFFVRARDFDAPDPCLFLNRSSGGVIEKETKVHHFLNRSSGGVIGKETKELVSWALEDNFRNLRKK